jgi:hypothetical protein
MEKRYRRTLVVLAVLGLAGFMAVAVPPAYASGAVWIPPSPGLNGVTSGDVRLGTTPPGNPERDGTAYRVWSWHGGCMDADSDTIRRNGGKVQLFDCNTSVYQQWFLDRTGIDGLFRIRTVYRSVGCLDADNSVGAGGRIQVWQCLSTGQHNQLWWLVVDPPADPDPWRGQSAPVVQFVNDWNGQCIQLGGGEGDDLVLADCAANAGLAQAWWPVVATMQPNWPSSNQP